MAKLQDTQERLDKKKWFESKELGADKSGKMDYCNGCKFQSTLNSNCIASQEQRVCQSLCAKSYNKFSKTRKSK